MGPLLIGIDLGTGSSKGVLTDPAGTVLATAVRPRPRSMSMPHPGWAEVDAEGVWWADVVSIARELVGHAAGTPVAGVCVSGVGPCLVLCDADDIPVRPAILYGIDMRATAEIDELTGRYGAERVLDRAATPITTQAVGPKALWVRRHEPQVWERATHWYTSSSYVVRKLTGEYVLDHHTASQSVPLYDIEARTWHRPWYADLMGDLPAPRLAWSAEVVGTVSAAAAEATGLPVGTPVCAGTVDAWAEAVSVGVRHPGDLMLMYGSTMFFVQVLRDLARHPQLWNTAGVGPDAYCLAAGMATSGSLTSWLRELVGDVPFETLVAEAARVPAGADGLLLLPYFAGERTPIFDPHARGVVAGLTLRHGRGHLFRAVYEGIAFGVRQILELLDTAENPVRRLVAVGGGTQGGLWTRIVSDVTGRTQEVPAVTIGASYGDALLAGIGAGLLAPDTDWTVPGATVEPDPAARDTYDLLYRQYGALYRATRDQVHTLARLQGDTGAAGG
ncbi:FGGY-family carbohydrate kinase [Micromonospora cathayae]|uniref:FGGY-family carbohydrate kinase n=1 Tax=Micromonospora cathayae TaxID=3028804 RepID=A0ABY7ZK43_9ACTN|nr:FGGY-family carbohydrate kinase [Micromonospora sp. HUAS 3]WDZ83359.1 FGGY-family carbohydrate kinase [Micromonospora sp. HUAS 3]